MADKDSNEGNAGAADPSKVSSTPPFDRLRVQAERRAATNRLLARLKAIASMQEAQTSRAYASRYVREQEPLILRLLDAGVGTDEILADLALSFSSIPRTELRDAIAQLHDRRRKQIGGTTAPSGAHALNRIPATGGTVEAQPSTICAPPASNQRPDESNEDYRLRQSLEGSGGLSRQFIGEH